MTAATADTYADAFAHPVGRTYQRADGRHLDPMAVHRDLVLGTHGKIDDLLAAAGVAADAETAAALGTLAAVARTAFALAPFDAAAGVGATEGEALDELYRYLELAGVAGEGVAAGAGPGGLGGWLAYSTDPGFFATLPPPCVVGA